MAVNRLQVKVLDYFLKLINNNSVAWKNTKLGCFCLSQERVLPSVVDSYPLTFSWFGKVCIKQTISAFILGACLVIDFSNLIQ